MGFDKGATASGYLHTYPDYETISGNTFKIQLPSTSDLWATGVDFAVSIYSGGNLLEIASGSVDADIYNPYYMTIYTSGDDLLIENPTWDLYCSGIMTSGMLTRMDAESLAGLSESEMRDVLYKFTGLFYTFYDMVRRPQYVRITWNN